MNDKAQRIAISEVCGWKCDYYDEDTGFRTFVYRSPDNPKYLSTILPRYLDDLNAMHDAEKLIPNRDRSVYHTHLMRIIGPDGSVDLIDDYGNQSESPSTSYFAMLHATAAQKAEAFLRTIGKWEEE